MEKLRITREKQFCNRLLVSIFFVLFSLCSAAFSITPLEIKNLVILSQENVFFTNQELKFVLEIPDTVPQDVQTELQNMKDGVSFVSSRRMEYFTDSGQTGTRVEFWFTFHNTGLIEIPPLIVRIKGRTYYLPFEKVQIYENPKTIAPRLLIDINHQKMIYSNYESYSKSLENFTSTVSEPIELTIYVQYASQIKQFGYEIPKDSIFEELNRYEIIQGKARSTEFSQERIPVAKFKWTPLKEGKYQLPNVRLLATAYSGRSLELSLPDYQLIITKRTTPVEDAKKSDHELFAYALSNPMEESNVEKPNKATKNDFYQIAALRSRERHSFDFTGSAHKDRIILERSIGITTSQNEASVPLLYALLIGFVLFLSVAIILFFIHRSTMAVLVLALSVVFGSFAVISAMFVSEKHAIVAGGSISPVPEDSAMSSTAVTAGTCVRIKEQTDLWFYIEYNENGGWIKKENLIVIE
ncbi:hypothetical protein [Treponema sp.]|uniref:hypothetical protein n=1 Tax=Treponema sp. TaxID=166 RepID=UPI00298D9207|nr:hypothetical protein [Treponema sp.]MCR5613810.1 hypothetical protein [Treponema sp.]